MKITRGSSATYAIDGPKKQCQCFIKLLCWIDGAAEGILAWWTTNTETFETCQQSPVRPPACSCQITILQKFEMRSKGDIPVSFFFFLPKNSNWNYIIKIARIMETSDNRKLSWNVHPRILWRINAIQNIYQSKKGGEKKLFLKINSLSQCRPRWADDKRKIICAAASTGIKFTGGTILWYFSKILMTPHCRLQLLRPARCWRRIGYLHTK